MKNYTTLNFIARILLLVGGLNWGFIGFFDWDVVASIFGDMTTLTRLVYILVGLAALWKSLSWVKQKSR